MPEVRLPSSDIQALEPSHDDRDAQFPRYCHPADHRMIAAAPATAPRNKHLGAPVSAVALIVLAATLILGGAGDGYPMIGAAIQMAAIFLLALCAIAPGPSRFGAITRCGIVLIIAATLLPLLHLLPLPPALIPEVPGRDHAAAVWAMIGVDANWRPLSLDRGYTLDTMLELLPALGLFWAALLVGRRRQRALLAVVVAVAVISALVGVFQRASGVFYLFADAHDRNATGLFVNRNHQATFLLVAMVLVPAALSAVTSLRGAARTGVIAAAALLFAGGVIATTSRAGLILLPLALAATAFLTLETRVRAGALLGGIAALVIAGAIVAQNAAVRLVLARFAQVDERAIYWQDSIPAIRAFWPAGSGIGTFTRVFPIYEDDTLVAGTRINAAHNDYVQLLLEGGLPAAVLIVAGVALIGWAIIRLGRAPPGEARLGQAAGAAIVIVLLHSIVDYPLRMLSMMAVLGLLAGVLLTGADRATDPQMAER